MNIDQLKEKIKEVCTYHSEDGTSGYLLNDEQFEFIFSIVEQAFQAGKLAGLDDAIKEIKKR